MDSANKVLDIIFIVVPMLMGVVTLIVQATPTPKDDNVWSKIALILGRFFSAKTFQDTSGKSNVSLPVLGSAKPKSEK